MNWYQRLFTRIGLASETKQLGKVDTKPTQIEHGASYISNGGRSAYSQLGSLGAYVQHPYVYAALSRISQDLAATPLKLLQGKGQNAKVIENHPALDLIEEPSTGIDQFSFLEQITIDLVAAGNAFILILGETETPVSIVRLHPEQVGIVTNETGIIGYRFDADGSSVLYTPDRVIHVKNAGWATGHQGLYGVGAVQPTQQEIKADLNVSGLVEVASKKGRPDVILSPKNELDVWQEETRRDVLDRYNGMIEQGGAIVLSGQVQVDVANTSPRDVEFSSVKEFSKLAITAAFGTPLSILGEGSANFATARQEAIIHWSNVEKRGKKIAWALTKIARRFDSSLRFEFDYSGVEALNAMRTEQIERVSAHILNGMEPGAAYAFEGLGEAPIGSNQQRQEPVETPALDEEEQVASLASWLERSYHDDEESTEEVERTVEKEEDPLAKYGSLQEAFDALPDSTQKALTKKAADHNEEHPEKSKRTSKLKLAAVYWRGIGAYNTNPGSVRPSVNSAEQWAMGRVNSFLYALRNGKFRSGKHDTDLLPKDHPMASDEEKRFDQILEEILLGTYEKKGSVGDVDPTNFPVDGENEPVDLQKSQWKTFDPEYAEDLKLNWPRIWKAGGNIEGNNQYRRLYPIATRQDQEAKTDTEEMAIRKREAWNARHFEDGSQHEDPELSPNLSNVAGIVAQIKWLAVGSLGERKMKAVLNELKAKLEEQKRMKRKARWNHYIKAKSDPAERMIQKVTRQYLLDASRRYKKRIRQNVVKGKKGIVDLGELQAIEEERRQIFNTIGGAFQRVWNLSGDQELVAIFEFAKIPKPLDLNFSSQELLIELTEEMAKEISRTTANAVTKSIQNSLINGESISQIADNIDQIAAFGVGRSMTIARTEATKALNRSAVEAYRQASQETGLSIKKEWLSVQDGNTRPSHSDLDGVQVGIDDEFETDGLSTLAPGSFGDPAEDCNCRCTVIPVVQ